MNLYCASCCAGFSTCLRLERCEIQAAKPAHIFRWILEDGGSVLKLFRRTINGTHYSPSNFVNLAIGIPQLHTNAYKAKSIVILLQSALHMRISKISRKLTSRETQSLAQTCKTVLCDCVLGSGIWKSLKVEIGNAERPLLHLFLSVFILLNVFNPSSGDETSDSRMQYFSEK